MHIKYANQKEKKNQHSIASIFLGCRLNTVAAVFISLLVLFLHMCTSASCIPISAFPPEQGWEGALQIGIFFILLYYCEVQMYING